MVTFEDILKFNPYHDQRGRFATAGSAVSFTYSPGKSKAHDKAIRREKDRSDTDDDEPTGKGFKGTLYHGSPATDIEEFDIGRAGANTSTGEKLIFFTDSKQMADDFSYERLEGSSMFTNRRGKKGRVYEVDVEMKNPLDFRNLSDKDIDNILKLDVDGILTKDMVKMYAQKNHQLLKSGLELTSESLKSLGYDGLIANAGKAGHNSTEYAVVDSSQTKIKKSSRIAKTFDEIMMETEITSKSARKSVLFIGLKIDGASSLAVKGGEKIEDFHVTLLYGYFDPKLRDSDAIDVCVQSAIDEVRENIPDKIKFDAIKRFTASESSDGKDVIYAQVAAGQLEQVHKELLKALKKKKIDVKDTFPEYKPHMTLAYIDPGEKYELSEIDETGTVKRIMIGHGRDSTSENNYTIKKRFCEILKFNPYHDAKGRFASADSATSFTYAPGKSKAHDNAIAREKERHAAGKPEAEDTPRMKVIHSIEDKIRNQNYETAAVVDKDGNVLVNKDGGQRSVGFTPMECAMMKDNTLTHNHPRSSMFSEEDISCFVANDMLEMRATTREGTTFSVKRGEGYDRIRGAEFFSDFGKSTRQARATAQNELDKKGFAEKILRGEITAEYANKEFGKVVTRELTSFCKDKAPDYNLVFSVEKRSVSKSADDGERIAKSASDGEGIVLDRDTEASNDAAFNEWLDKHNIPREEPTEKSFSIYKTEDDKRLVFGWASVSIKVDGEQVEDRQEDIIDPEDLEAAAYEYVLKFRDTGEEHISTMRKKGKLVESCVFTAEKQKAMGIPEGILPIGWWIGFKIEDDSAWEKVKNGTYKMFSIEGKAVRVPIEKAARNYDEFPSYDMWLEENLDASFEEQKAAKEYFKTRKRSVEKTFDDIIDEVFP